MHAEQPSHGAAAKKVLIVIETLSPSGAERQLEALIPDLRRRGMEFELAALMPTQEDTLP